VNDSPLAQALERVGDRWTLLLVDALLVVRAASTSWARTSADRAEHPDAAAASPRTEALLVATPYSERPRRFEYQLTESGRELAGALRLLADWGSRGGADGEPLTHAACGTPLEARWYCPTCGEAVDETEAAAAEFV